MMSASRYLKLRGSRLAALPIAAFILSRKSHFLD